MDRSIGFIDQAVAQAAGQSGAVPARPEPARRSGRTFLLAVVLGAAGSWAVLLLAGYAVYRLL